MFSGTLFKWFNLDVLSTHHILNRLAYEKIKTKLNPKVPFPSLQHIQQYEGRHGPDGEMIRCAGRASDHMYNPTTNEGGALKQVQISMKRGSAALARGNLNRAAREIARVSHFIIDALTPPHQIGTYRGSHGAYDWTDPYWDYKYTLSGQFKNPHVRFEAWAAWVLFLKQKWIFSKIKAIRFMKKPSLVLSTLKHSCQKLAHQRVYRKFLENKNIEPIVEDQIFPKMIHLIASAWISMHHSSYRGNSPKKRPSRTT